jgi:ribonuclease PH
VVADVISDVIRSATVGELSDRGFPHPTRVASQVLLSGGHFNQSAHIVAAVTALRMRGFPVAPVGASRVGLMGDGSYVFDPSPKETEKATAVASCVVSETQQGKSIAYLEVDSKFVSVELCSKVRVLQRMTIRKRRSLKSFNIDSDCCF